MKRICKNCKYFREQSWCSNFVSFNFRYSAPLDIFMLPDDTCDEFAPIGKKAPWWMRLTNWIMRG